MLAITRRMTHDNSESRVMIGDNIILTLLYVGDGRVRLGFTAPKEVRITREELLTPEQVQEFEQRAKG